MINHKLDLKHYESKTFEIVLMIKDSKGNPTNRTKRYRTDSAFKLFQFWMRYQGKPKHRYRKANKQDQLPTNQEAEKILKNMYKEENNEV